jgi:hypothetical protein
MQIDALLFTQAKPNQTQQDKPKVDGWCVAASSFPSCHSRCSNQNSGQAKRLPPSAVVLSVTVSLRQAGYQ